MSSIDRATRDLLIAADRELAGEVVEGVPAMLDGERVAWVIERMIAGADLRRADGNPWRADEGSRARLAAATGRALAGARAAAFVDGADLVSCRDQIAVSVARSIPLVVYASLRAGIAHGVPTGTGHDALAPLADAGAVVVVGRDVQEIVDLSLVARRVAETARVPVVVAMDRDETGRSPAAVTLPTPGRVRSFIGDATQGVEPNDPTEAMLFGTLRRRMARLVDAERPLTLGVVSGPEVWSHGALARELFEDGRTARAWHDACEVWARTTTREIESLSVEGGSRSKITLVASGHLAALAERVLATLPGRKAKAIRVATLRAWRPLDETALVNAIAGAERVVVLERTTAVEGADTPLARTVRAVVMRALERGKVRGSTGATLKEKERPSVHAVRIGLGGAPVRAADLAALCLGLADGDPVPDALGVDVAPLSVAYPKRRILAERLRRELPGAMGRTRRAEAGASPASPVAAVVTHEPRTTVLGETLAALLAGAAGDARTLVRAHGEGRTTIVALGTPPAADDVAALEARVEAGWDGELDAALGAIASRLAAEMPALAERKLVSAHQRLIDDRPAGEREARTARFREALAGGHLPDGVTLEATSASREATGPIGVPVRAQRSGRHDETLTSLSRFWDHVGVLYRDGRLEDLSPDPYLGTGALPPLSASLTPARPAALPVLDAVRCTGCGECWTVCPEGALGVTMLTPKDLLDRGIEEAKRSGADPGALQMILSKLATSLARMTKGDDAPARAGEAVRATFETMAEKLPESRREALGEAAEAVARALDRLPIVRTAALYDDAETEEPGAGTLLSILADPDACTSCGLCTRVCEPDALPLEPLTPETTAAARDAWELWARLPDPAGPVLARASRHDDVGLAAATFASRHASMATASARRDGAGSGEMLALRLVIGAAESARQPIVAELGREVEKVRSALAEEVQGLLSGALPTDDLDALARGLSLSDEHEVSLGEITTRLEDAEREHRVDRDRLAAIVDVARRLADLSWRVMTGADGTGRARMSLVVAGESLAARTACFPDTIFGSPTVVDVSPEAAHTARGLARGLGETLLEDVRLLRRARLLLAHPLVEADAASESLPMLGWDDLTDDERRWCTPLVVLADEASPGARDLAETLLGETRPISVVLLSEAIADAARDDRELGLLGLAAGRALCVQSSIGAADHLVRGVRDALISTGPSVVRVHAPSPARHGFAADGAIARAQEAIATRVHPLLHYAPGQGEVFGGGIDLDGNPDPLELWTRDDDARHRTPADWAVGERRYASDFSDVVEGATRISVADSVGLDREKRDGKTAVVPADDGERAVGDRILAWCASRRRAWRTLQELSGLVTPFTDRVRDAAERDVSSSHAAEIESLRQQHAAALRETEERVRAELYGTVRERLTQLAARGRALSGGRS